MMRRNGLTAGASGVAGLLLLACSGGGVEGAPSPATTGSGSSVGGQQGGGQQGGGPSGSSTSTPSGPQDPTKPPPVGTGTGYTLACNGPAVGGTALRLLTRYEVTNTLNDIFPAIKGKWSDSLPSSPGNALGFDNDARNAVGNQFAEGLLATAETVATAVVGDSLSQILPCAAKPDRACATQYLSSVGRRLFRRPLTQAENDRYLTFFDSALGQSDFKTAIKWVTVGLIQSPNAVYRSEVGTAGSDGKRKLTPLELATELSYTYSGTTPTEDLLAKAEKGDIGDPAAIAKALLDTAAGKQQLLRFFEAYLGYTNVLSLQKSKISDFVTLAPDMVQETRSYIDDIVFKGKGGLAQLLTSGTTNPSVALASYYGMPAPPSANASIPRPLGKGLGLLAQGSFLASHANGEASSPTQRGVFVYRRLFCQPNLSPPPNVPSLDTAPVTHTTRERYELAHMTQGSGCSGCHLRFDPIGFGFEHFDEGGRYRDKEGDYPVNSVASVTGADLTTEWFKFTTQEELVTELAKQDVTHQCFASYMAGYAYGFPTASDGSKCLGVSAAGNNVSVVDGFLSLATAPHFATRNAE